MKENLTMEEIKILDEKFPPPEGFYLPLLHDIIKEATKSSNSNRLRTLLMRVGLVKWDPENNTYIEAKDVNQRIREFIANIRSESVARDEYVIEKIEYYNSYK